MLPHDRRSARRLESGHLVVHSETERDPAADCLGMAVTLDINEFGLRMQSAQRFDVGQRFRFSMALQEEVIQALGRIVHCAATLNNTYEVGVEFLEISTEGIEAVRAFMAQKPKSS